MKCECECKCESGGGDFVEALITVLFVLPIISSFEVIGALFSREGRRNLKGLEVFLGLLGFIEIAFFSMIYFSLSTAKDTASEETSFVPSNNLQAVTHQTGAVKIPPLTPPQCLHLRARFEERQVEWEGEIFRLGIIKHCDDCRKIHFSDDQWRDFGPWFIEAKAHGSLPTINAPATAVEQTTKPKVPAGEYKLPHDPESHAKFQKWIDGLKKKERERRR